MFIENYKKSQPYSTFLLDAIGAFVSLLVLLVVILPFKQWFGMPVSALYILCILASIMFFYSSLCFFKKPKHWKPFLLGVILGNLTYCSISTFFLITYWHQLETLGAFYFIWEKIVVLAIVGHEALVWKK
ncbi:hypothetical protein AB3N58_06160 [Leptospira sp. WS60.C2]